MAEIEAANREPPDDHFRVHSSFSTGLAYA